MAQLNDLLVLGYTSLLGTVNASGEIIASKFTGDGSSITNISAGNIGSGTLPVTRGGTGTATAPKAGGIIYGASTSAYGCISAGSAGQVLLSGGAGAPTWHTPTSSNTASRIVIRDASGNFSAGTITADLSGLATVSSKQRIELTDSTSATNFNILFSTGATAGENYLVRANDGFKYRTLNGTDAAKGYSILLLGNALSGVDTIEAGNKYGGVRIYSAKKGYANIYAKDSDSNSSHYLPTSGGTLLNENTLTWGNVNSDIASIGDLTINGTAHTLYDTFLYRRGASLVSNAITDINTIKVPSVYYSNSSTDSAGLTNAPTTGEGFRLVTLAGYQGASDYGSQMAFSGNGRVYWRTMGNNNGSPSDWYMWVKFKRGTAIGSKTIPFYLTADGVPTEGDTYAGGTKVTLNGTDKGKDTASFYAPTAAGTAGAVLTSASSAPAWSGNVFVTSSASSGQTTPGTINALSIYGSTYGNTAANIKTAGKLSYGDPGPQLRFNTSASGSQAISLIYTDNDTIYTGNSLTLTSTEEDAAFITPTLKATRILQGSYNINRLYTSLVPAGTSIAASADLKTTAYLKVGNYTCSANDTAVTLKNCPVSRAFLMQVYSPLSATIDNETTTKYIYRIRKIIEYSTGIEYIQCVSSGATAGTFTYGSWKIVPHSTITLDEEDTNGATLTKGSTTKPVYINSDGLLTAGSTYAGGTKVTLNGTAKGATTASFYAPTGAGTSGYILKSNGSGAPTWLQTLPVANGGTGATTFTSGNALIGNGTGAVTTRAITNNTTITHAGWSSNVGTNLITLNTLAYWDGRYADTGCNLKYINATDEAPTQKFYPLWTTGSGVQKIRVHDMFSVYKANAVAYLVLGNASNLGGITLHKGNGKYVDFKVNVTDAANNKTINFPDFSGTVAMQAYDNNFITYGNEFNFIPSNFEYGTVWFNYRNAKSNKPITAYNFGNGLGAGSAQLNAGRVSLAATDAAILFQNTTEKPANGTQLPIMYGTLQNSGNGTFYTSQAIAALVGAGETGSTTNNMGVRFGSVSGATFITSGESGSVMPSKLGAGNESLWLTSDGNITFYAGCVNEGTNHADAKVMTMTSTGITAHKTITGSLSGNATTATLLQIRNESTNTTTRTTTSSTWNGGVTGLQYVWGQAWKDTSIGSDTGDLVLGLRSGTYTSGGTELCMMIDGDYYSMGKKVLHQGNFISTTTTLAKDVTTWTCSVSGVTASNTVIISPAPTSFTEYLTCGVYCSGQASGKLTFAANTAPTSNLTVNIFIYNP